MPNRRVSKIIGKRPFTTVAKATSVRDVAIIMKEWHTSAVLVMDKEILLGICTERDIASKAIAMDCNPATTSVECIMTTEVQTIHKDQPLGHALHLMYEGGFRHVPVMDDAGRPVGLLTAHDALDAGGLQLDQQFVRRDDIALNL